MYYSTADKVEAIFNRRNKNFYLIPWDAIHQDINAADISNHTARNWAYEYGKVLSVDEFADLFNSGSIDKTKYYIRVL